MNKVMALATPDATAAGQLSPQQIEILKSSMCKGLTNEEFQVFLMACNKTQLDPFMKQIYAIPRKSRQPDGSYKESMTIQTGIDGYRLIAERTGCYAPGPEPTYTYDQEGKVLSACAYIKKQTRDGTWHTVSASAYMDEYCQKSRDGSAMGMWRTLPRTMLAKCAEAQALRKAFPAEMSGIYTKEEMSQADTIDVTASITPKISAEQATDLEMILAECDEKYRNWVYEHLQKVYKATSWTEVSIELFDKIKAAAMKKMEENHARQKAALEPQLVESAQ